MIVGNLNTRQIVILVTIGMVIFIGGFILGKADFKKIKNQLSEQRLENGQLTNPLLECDTTNSSIDFELSVFKPVIEKYVNKQIDTGNLSDVSVYFRQLNDGLWFGINEKKEFTPASLLKVPLMIAYFKSAEENPSVLNQTLRLNKKFDTKGLKQVVSYSSEIKEGQEYPVTELIERMITNSDNQASLLLVSRLNSDFEVDLLKKFGFSNEVIENFSAKLSIRDYSKFFRILFNASYISQKYSEQALSILTKTEFKDGLVAGVPGNIVVAHKFGERGDLDSKNLQFHDCGIVYYPKRPYVLCIMTRGNDYQKLIDIIRNISKITYEEVDKQSKKLQ